MATITKYRMLVGEGYIETTSLDEAIASGYEYVEVTETVEEMN
jgi:hypothetical protein